MSRTYYLRQGNEVSGPVVTQKLREMAANGTLHETDYIRATDQDKWHVAGRVKGLFPDTVQSSRGARPLAAAPREHSSPTPAPPIDSTIESEDSSATAGVAVRIVRSRVAPLAIAGGLIIGIVVVAALSRRSSTNELSGEKPASVAARRVTNPERSGVDDARLAERNITVAYVLLRDEVTADATARGHIEIDLLIKDRMSREAILDLLTTSYNEAIRREVFKNRKYANWVNVAAYSSVDHYRAEHTRRSLAEIRMTPALDEPRIDFNDVLHEQMFAPPEMKHALSEPTRKEIYEDYLRADSRAWEEARGEYATDPDLVLKAGDSFHLVEPVALMGTIDAEEWFAQGAPSMTLPAGTEIKIIQTVKNDSGTKWTQVAAYPPNERSGYEGWIVTVSLGYQHPILKDSERLSQQLDLQSVHAKELKKRYIAMVLKARGISQDVLESIYKEGCQKQWAY